MAEVKMPTLLADHMVIQRSMPVHIWGTADPGEEVSVDFRGTRAVTKADAVGDWSVTLPPEDAGGPFEMKIQGSNVILWHDVLVGDVWIASGQSNMDFPVKGNSDTSAVQNADAEIASANHPEIRLFKVNRRASPFPKEDLTAETWTACRPDVVSKYSAVGYFFARAVHDREKVPIGLVQAAWGGTAGEAWTSLSALSADPALMSVFAARAKEMEDQSVNDKWLAAHLKIPGATGFVPTNLSAWDPAAIFNGMIAPLTKFPIRGVIWYQGEDNTDSLRAPVYARLLQTMIQDWRNQWKQGNFPFLFVQLANIESQQDWPTVRDAQRKALSLVNTGMATTIDIGTPKNIHPQDKQDVGYRLSLLARAVAYGEAIEDSGPLFRLTFSQGTSLHIWFDHAGSGLTIKSEQLTGFEVAGRDGKFMAAHASIGSAGEVIVSSTLVPKPVYVRYAWSANPLCTLYNKEGLPASPFSAQAPF